MAEDFRGLTPESLLILSINIHTVVSDKTVTTFHQLKPCLTLTDARVSLNKNSHPVDIYQNTMDTSSFS